MGQKGKETPKPIISWKGGLKKNGGAFLLIFMVLLGTAPLMGQLELKAQGKLALDGAENYKYFKGVITFTPLGIDIKCEQPLFRHYNDFDAPRSKKLFVNILVINRIEIFEETGHIHIATYHSFIEKYRNFFIRFYYRSIMATEDRERLVFIVDKPQQLDYKKLKRLVASVPVALYK